MSNGYNDSPISVNALFLLELIAATNHVVFRSLSDQILIIDEINGLIDSK